MSQNSVESLTLRALDGTTAEVVPALGGIVSSLMFPCDGALREVLFRHVHFWDSASTATRGGIPLLFPVCGRLRHAGEPGRYAAKGRNFHMPLHGFAMRKPWAIEEQATASLVCTLSDDADTRALYPYAFTLRAEYRVAPGVLSVAFDVKNTDVTDLPFSAGWHPYFQTPPVGAQKEGMRVSLAARTCGRYEATYTDIPEWGAPLPMPLSPDHPLFSHVLHESDGPVATVTWPDGFHVELHATQSGAAPARYWQLHTDPALPFVCVEPWTSPPNALNTHRALIQLPPGASWRMSLVLTAPSGR